MAEVLSFPGRRFRPAPRRRRPVAQVVLLKRDGQIYAWWCFKRQICWIFKLKTQNVLL